MNIISVQADIPIISPFIKTSNWNGKSGWDGVNWQFQKDWCCRVKAKEYEYELILKSGMVSDGGSIPTIVQNIFKPMGIYYLAYLNHDGFYCSEIIDRLLADNILFDLLQYQGMTWFGRQQVYSAVRIGGGFVWGAHTKDSLSKAKELVEFKWIVKPNSNYSLKVSENKINKLFPNKLMFAMPEKK